MDNKGYILAAFTMGAALGAAFGLLYAPESGEKTRRMLSEKACETAEKIGSVRLAVGAKSDKNGD